MPLTRSLYLTAILVASPSLASASCPDGTAWVQITVSEGWPIQTREAVLADLRAELEPLHIEACERGTDDATDPLADVRLDRPDPERVSVVIEVHDAVTNKRVARDVALDEVPDAGRSLTIALAVVELLRASWIELRLRSAPTPTLPVPAVVEEAVAADEAPRGPPENALGLSALFEHSVGGLSQLGGALRYRRWLVDAFAVGLQVGGRYGLPMESAQGRVDTVGLAAAIDLRLAISPREEIFYAGFELSAALLVLRFDGTGADGIRGVDATDVGLSVRGSVFGRVRLVDALGIEATVGVGVPVLGLLASDGDGPVGGLETFEVIVTLGPTLAL